MNGRKTAGGFVATKPNETAAGGGLNFFCVEL